MTQSFLKYFVSHQRLLKVVSFDNGDASSFEKRDRVEKLLHDTLYRYKRTHTYAHANTKHKHEQTDVPYMDIRARTHTPDELFNTYTVDCYTNTYIEAQEHANTCIHIYIHTRALIYIRVCTLAYTHVQRCLSECLVRDAYIYIYISNLGTGLDVLWKVSCLEDRHRYTTGSSFTEPERMNGKDDFGVI